MRLDIVIYNNDRYFTEDETYELTIHQPGVDTEIKLIKDEIGKEKEIPFGPPYGMSLEELLALRKA